MQLTDPIPSPATPAGGGSAPTTGWDVLLLAAVLVFILAMTWLITRD